jgi:DNA-binding PadR family transcriptional regulator
MMEDIAAIAGIQLGPGTLYGVIARLELHGWIEALPAIDRRHPYQLTATGLTVLREHLAILERFTAAGLERVATL